MIGTRAQAGAVGHSGCGEAAAGVCGVCQGRPAAACGAAGVWRGRERCNERGRGQGVQRALLGDLLPQARRLLCRQRRHHQARRPP